MKKEYYGFDILKFILSLLVVQIHIGLFSSYNLELEELFKNLIGRYAVPLFFMISSYLLFEKIDKNNLFSSSNILVYKNYFRRLVILYFGWSLIYFICFKFFLNVEINLDGFLVNYLFIGFYRQFWFIVAQIFGTLLCLVLLRFFSIKKIVFIGGLFYIVGLILLSYNSIFVDSFKFIPEYNGNVFLVRNFLNFALLFISLGFYFNFNKSRKVNQNALIYILLFSILFSIIEFIYLRHINCAYYALQIFIIFVCISIFLLSLKVKLKYKPIYTKLRKYSILIFCMHTLVYLFLEKFLSYYSFFDNSVVIYLGVVLVSIIFSEIIIYINKKFIRLDFLY